MHPHGLSEVKHRSFSHENVLDRFSQSDDYDDDDYNDENDEFTHENVLDRFSLSIIMIYDDDFTHELF